MISSFFKNLIIGNQEQTSHLALPQTPMAFDISDVDLRMCVELKVPQANSVTPVNCVV